MEKYKTFFPRLAALLIDTFIMMPIVVFDDWFRQAEFSPLFFYIWIPVSALVFPLYTILMHARFGQTLGKMYMNVKVVDAATEEPIKFNQAVRRNIPQLFFNLFSVVLDIVYLGVNPEAEELKIPYGVFGFLGFVWFSAQIITFFSNEKCRALHDYIAGTVVVKTDV